ncbi:MAG TPA: NAD(P)/FAD-dependent oxidoreductase [Ottowia sp.]|nr:NAD(P)/FAD-dependent oxidoreductase [Ottowia sp.]
MATDDPGERSNAIVIVGGGAGGLELACKLGRRLGAERVTLVDQQLFHIWKPTLHEVAAGTLDIHQEGLSYEMLAHDNGFRFVYGPLVALDAARRSIGVGAIHDESGEELLPVRELGYDRLVLALGSTSRYFGVPGAPEHTLSLNDPESAEQFRLRMLKLLAAADMRKQRDGAASVDVVIIGGGATGVELAAELREASAVHTRYGLRRLDPDRDVRITLLEGSPRLLAPLSEKVSAAALDLLRQRHVDVHTDCRVTRIDAEGVGDQDGHRYPSALTVWAAGIEAPPLLRALGLPVNKSGQVEVDAQLRVPGWPGALALGDCAACAGPGGRPLPPRAQTAHQEASYLGRALLGEARGRPWPEAPYVYRDHGSLVSLGTSTSVGSLMGVLFSKSWFVEGLFARLMYMSLHLMHHEAVLGVRRTTVLALARFLIKRATPRVKLH